MRYLLRGWKLSLDGAETGWFGPAPQQLNLHPTCPACPFEQVSSAMPPPSSPNPSTLAVPFTDIKSHPYLERKRPPSVHPAQNKLEQDINGSN